MKLLVFLSVLAMSGSGGGADFILPELTHSHSGETYVKFHNLTIDQLFCEVKWSWGKQFFWVRPEGHSEWIHLDLPYELVCGSFVDEDTTDTNGEPAINSLQLGGVDIK